MCPDQERTRDTICSYPQCSRRVWKDPDGSFSMFCGLTHRNAMANQDALPVCKNCQKRPVYVENGRELDFCGRRCALEARQGNSAPNSNRSSVTTVNACSIAGCARPAFVAHDGTVSQWCSQSHRRQALNDENTERCLLCKELPKTKVNDIQSDYCSRTCGQEAISLAPIVLSINYHYSKFKEVAQQFMDSWKHPSRVPTVIKVWRIIGLPNLVDDHARYKLAVERDRNLPEGNSKRRWHGTVRHCKLGDDDTQNALCGEQSCSLCRIIESSFNVAKFQQRFNFGRFGAGIYTSATSSKANDYVIEKGSNYKAMLLNDVVLGKAIKLTVDTPNLTEPPAGYDSVIGEPGYSLNYDEAIVYKNEAIRPLYLVIYL